VVEEVECVPGETCGGYPIEFADDDTVHGAMRRGYRVRPRDRRCRHIRVLRAS
jgi:hypothetical protein